MSSSWSERVGDAADVGGNPQKSQRQTRLPDAPACGEKELMRPLQEIMVPQRRIRMVA
jgi:hypothetical protein